MSLRQIIKRSQIIKQNLGSPLVLHGEPMLYSIKYSMGERRRPVQFFRDKKWASMLKCWFPTYKRKEQPVVLIVCFYVSPFTEKQYVTPAELKAERTPACHSWELADILISLLEMLRGVLFGEYRQIVKIDCMKFYSAEPRTTFQYLSWANYVNLQNHNPLDAKAETICTVRAHKKNAVQPKRKRNGKANKLRAGVDKEGDAGADRKPIVWSVACDRPLSVSGPEALSALPSPQIPLDSPCEKTGRGQLRKVPK